MKFDINILKNLIDIVGELSFDDSGIKTRQLFELIKEDKEITEDKAKVLLYGSISSADSNYQKLKVRLSKKLIDSSLHLSTGGLPTYNIVYENCYKTYSAIKILIGRGQKNTAISMASTLLRTVRKYHFTELNYLLAFELWQHYSLIGNQKNINSYEKEFYKSFEIHKAELKIESYFSNLSATLTKSKNLCKEERKGIHLIIENINSLSSGLSSFKLNYKRYLSNVIGAYIKNDSTKIIAINNQALDYFKELAFKPGDIAFFSFSFYLIPALVISKNYANAKASILNCESLTKAGSYNWNITIFYLAIFGFYSSYYDDCRRALEMSKKYKDRIPPNIKEHWKIIEAYLYLLQGMGKIPSDNSRFRINKFLNEVPIYSKDKLGGNISIIVIQILLLLCRGNKGKIIDKMDALRKYSNKYLKKDNTFRNQCFIKIILQLEVSHFHKVAFERKAKPYFIKLKSSPATLSDLEIEIIPYEQLYNFVLELL